MFGVPVLLARESRASNLVTVALPDERDEAIRDLSRAREDAGTARLRARLQLKAMLLRHGRSYQGKSSWTAAHEQYLARIKFDHPAQQITFDKYRQAAKDAHERVERLTQALREQCEQWRMKGVVKALTCMRGMDFVAAATFIAELGDLSRFAHPKALMKYLGLIPSEFSSGTTRRQGPITKAGNKHARRILVEAAWTYRFNPRVSHPIEVRQEGHPQGHPRHRLASSAAPRISVSQTQCGAENDSKQVLRSSRPGACRPHLGYRSSGQNSCLSPSPSSPADTGGNSPLRPT